MFKKFIDGKPVIVKSNSKNIPSFETIKQVYRKIPDNKNIPIVFQTKKQYLKEYIKNQEVKKNIDFTPAQEKQYIKHELKDMNNVVSRYTTRQNPYIDLRTVFFTDKKITPKQFEASAYHEYAHEAWDHNPKIRKDWKTVNRSTAPTPYGKTDRQEDFAESYMLHKMGRLKDPRRKAIISKDTQKKDKQWERGKPLTVYHGTLSKNVNSIKREGIIPGGYYGTQNDDRKGVFVTTDPYMAYDYGEGSNVFKITLPAKDVLKQIDLLNAEYPRTSTGHDVNALIGKKAGIMPELLVTDRIPAEDIELLPRKVLMQKVERQRDKIYQKDPQHNEIVETFKTKGIELLDNSTNRIHPFTDHASKNDWKIPSYINENKGYKVINMPTDRLYYMRGRGNLPENKKIIMAADDYETYGRYPKTKKELLRAAQQHKEFEEGHGTKIALSKPRKSYLPFIGRRTIIEAHKHEEPWRYKLGIQGVMEPSNYTDLVHKKTYDDPNVYVNELSKTLLSPEKSVPMIELSKTNLMEESTGEGRHRILAAKQAGYKYIPVIIDDTPEINKLVTEKKYEYTPKQKYPEATNILSNFENIGMDIDSEDKRFDSPVKPRYPGRKGFDIKWYPTDEVLERHKKVDGPELDITNPNNQIGNRLPNATEFIKEKKFMTEDWPGGGIGGFEPTLVNQKGSISDGRHRLLALKNLGYTEIPVEEFQDDRDRRIIQPSRKLHSKYNPETDTIDIDPGKNALYEYNPKESFKGQNIYTAPSGSKIVIDKGKGLSEEHYPSVDDISYFYDNAPKEYSPDIIRLRSRTPNISPQTWASYKDIGGNMNEDQISIYPRKKGVKDIKAIKQILIHETGHKIDRDTGLLNKYLNSFNPKDSPSPYAVSKLRLKNKYPEAKLRAAAKEDIAESFAMWHPGIRSYNINISSPKKARRWASISGFGGSSTSPDFPITELSPEMEVTRKADEHKHKARYALSEISKEQKNKQGALKERIKFLDYNLTGLKKGMTPREEYELEQSPESFVDDALDEEQRGFTVKKSPEAYATDFSKIEKIKESKGGTYTMEDFDVNNDGQINDKDIEIIKDESKDRYHPLQSYTDLENESLRQSIMKERDLEKDSSKNMAYIGFDTPEQQAQVNVMKNIFDKNPRLKLKRDVSVKDIIYNPDTEASYGSDQNIYIGPSVSTNKETFRILEHELTHASDAAKLGDKFWDIHSKIRERKEPFPKIFKIPITRADGIVGNDIYPNIEHYYDPIELKAIKQANDKTTLHGGKIIREAYPETRMEDLQSELHTALKDSPSLKTLPKIWRDDISNDMAKYYHGTDRLKAALIKREGILTVKDLQKDTAGLGVTDFKGNLINQSMSEHTNPGRTYFFDKPAGAKAWARVVSEQSGIPPAVIEVDLPAEEMTPDYNLRFPGSKTQAYSYPGSVPVEKIINIDYKEDK